MLSSLIKERLENRPIKNQKNKRYLLRETYQRQDRYPRTSVHYKAEDVSIWQFIRPSKVASNKELMKKNILMLSCFVLTASFSKSTYAYISGYTKLHRKNTGTVVDLIGHSYESLKRISVGELLLMGPECAFQRLFATEQKFLNSIRKWEAESTTCDLIWETALCDDWNLSARYFWCLLSMPSFFKLTTMNYVHFIPANRHRDCGFNTLFNLYQGKTRLRPQNLTGCSFDNPAPLAPEVAQEIEQMSGTTTWQNYKAARKRVIKNLKEFFAPWYHEQIKIQYEKALLHNSFSGALCALEILSHLLISKADRIVVCAGDWHCLNVSLFLEHNGFEILYSKHNPREDGVVKELAVSDLDPLEHRELQTALPSPSFLDAAQSALRGICPFF